MLIHPKRKWLSANLFLYFIILFLVNGCNTEKPEQAVIETPGGEMDRTSLPIKEPVRKTYTELDARNATPPPRFEVKAPKGAPNVVVVLIDDMGFGVSEAFGGPVTTPTMDKLAAKWFEV